jgi:serine/threonine protein kinase
MSSATPAPATPVADVFSIAVVLWELLAKQRLFTSKIEAAIVQKVLSAPIASLGTVPNASVPTALVDAVAKALDRNPEHRTASVAELRAVIEGLEGDSVATPKEVAAEVERLVGKALATRKADVRAEITRRANMSKGAASIPPPAPAKAFALPARKSTLLGIPAIKPSAATAFALPPPPALSDDLSALASAKSETAAEAKSESKSESTSEAPPKPAEAASPKPPSVAAAAPGPRAPAVSINLEDIEVASAVNAHAPPPAPPAAPRAPIVPRRPVATLLMGADVVQAAKAPAGKTPPPDDAPAPKLESSAKAEKAEKAEADKPAVAKPATPAPAVAAAKPAASAPSETGKTSATPAPAVAAAKPAGAALSEAGKTSATPSSDPSNRKNAAVEKVRPGSTLGRYEILMPVARGGMASVWAAKLPGSRGFQKIFAIKTMLPDVSDDPEFESMFLDEGRVAARIRHPNVVEIIDLGEQNDVLYLVMEWVEGENLGALVKAARAHGGIPMPIILRIASQICAGLHAAHELRDDDGNLLELVHRDVSPANVLVSSSGFVKIVDFGIAKSKGRLHVTRVGGMVKGKTPYLSPEQLGQQPVDRRSDIFSLGVMLYVLATGLHPFRGDTDGKTIENIALREPVPLRALQSEVPADFEALVLKALAKDPNDRFATAGELQRAIDQLTGTLGMGTTEEDVASFVRKALGEILTKRSQDLRAAIDGADGRGASIVDAEAGAGLTKGRASDADASARAEAAAAETVKPAPAKASEPSEGAAASDAGAKVVVAAVAAASVEHDVSFEGSEPKSEGDDAVAAKAARADLDLVLPPPPAAPRGSAPELPAPEESSARPVTRSGVRSEVSDVEDIPVEGVPPKRKPMGLIAVGAVLGVCALVGVIALAGGGKKDTPRTGTTSAPTVAAAPPTPEATTATATGATAPAATAPTPTAAATTAEPATPPPTPTQPTQPTAEQQAPPVPTIAKPTGRLPIAPATPVSPTKPPPVTKPKPKPKPYNPGTL